MSTDSSDENIEFRVRPRHPGARPNGYSGLVAVLLGIAVVLLIILAALQQKRLTEMQQQIDTSKQQIDTLNSRAEDLQKSLDACKGLKPPQ